MAKFVASIERPKTKCFRSSASEPLVPWPEALPLNSAGALPSDPRYRLALLRSPWGCAPSRYCGLEPPLSVTCHMGSCTERCLPTRHRGMLPALFPAGQVGTWLTYRGGMEGWVDLGIGCILRWELRGIVGHQSWRAPEGRCRIFFLTDLWKWHGLLVSGLGWEGVPDSAGQLRSWLWMMITAVCCCWCCCCCCWWWWWQWCLRLERSVPVDCRINSSIAQRQPVVLLSVIFLCVYVCACFTASSDGASCDW